jgi:UDP-N-acetylglucosamine 3-dehydrogenase
MQKVLVIGAGTMGTVHTEAYAAMDHAELVGIADIQKNKADRLAVQCGTKAFESYEEALRNLPQVDVIDVCLPTYLHKKYVKIAADAEKHVICEKPLARNLEDAREMIQYCKDRNVQLFVGHVIRFFREYKRAKEILETDSIGEVGVARTRRGGIFPTAWNDWYADFQNSGGLVLDMVIHDFDFLRWCFGEVERVYAKSLLGRDYLRLDYALVTLRFKNGVIAHVEGSWAHEGFSMAFELAGKSGIIDYDSSKTSSIKALTRNKEEGGGGVAVPESPLKENPYYLELKHFLSCIETGEDPVVSTDDAYKAMEISLAALRSIETGKPVTLQSQLQV